jgi:uncharacterized alpha-E superfamily protein
MLSRVANNLYWMGRYLERTEHLGRYLSVQYFASLDSPIPKQIEIALSSVQDMMGVPKSDTNILEEEVLVSAALDDQNPVSIISSVYLAREDARNVRDTISSQVWEAINNYYIFVSTYPIDVYKTRGLHDFTQNVLTHCSIIREKVDHTLLHDVRWNFIQLGIHVERAIQISRILQTHLNDTLALSKLKMGDAIEPHQWTVLLDCLEAKDMYSKTYNSLPNRTDALEFLLLNPAFPRSVLYNFEYIDRVIKEINPADKGNHDGVKFKTGKEINSYRYLTVDEINEHISDFLAETIKKTHRIDNIIFDAYFKR